MDESNSSNNGRPVKAEAPLLMDEDGNLSEAKTDPDVGHVEVAEPASSAPAARRSEGVGADSVTDLYGGAITCVLPSSFADASVMRQVPDNQEVWLDMESGLAIILELLEYEHSFKDKGHSPAQEQELVIRHIFDDITSTSHAQGHVVDEVLVSKDMGSTSVNSPLVRGLREHPQAVLTARHAVQQRARPNPLSPNSNGVEMDGVQIVSLNVRLQPVDTDLVLTLYMTRASQVSTSEPDSILDQMEPLQFDTILSDSSPPEHLPEVVQRGVRVLRRIFETLKVVDWSLFGA